MKKLFILTSVLALGALSSFAQGTVSGYNSGTGVLITVSDPNIAGGAITTIGKPATAAGFSAADVGPGAVTVTFYAAATTVPLTSLESVQNQVFVETQSASTLAGAQGTLVGATQTLPTAAAFSGSSPIEIIAYAVSGTGKYAAWSTEGTGITPATGTSLAPSIFGAAPLISSLNLVPVPEPSTIALGGLGAAALLAFRRRK
jgi:hypothetical protein